MCGRTAYSSRAISAAAAALSRKYDAEAHRANETATLGGKTSPAASGLPPSVPVPDEVKDRPNVGPGNEFLVFRRGDAGLDCVPMVWGLLPRHGAPGDPHHLPADPAFSASPHFAMFNARCETVCEKPSFRGLVRGGRTCVLAVEGYYEWTTSAAPRDKRKQPYFVRCENGRRPLLLAGLWTRVRTGRRKTVQGSMDDGGVLEEEDETIATFAILTTDAHPKYAWLHPRQPIMLWDESIALEWLTRPCPALVETLRTVPIGGVVVTRGQVAPKSIWETSMTVFPVSKEVNDWKYQGDDCTTEVKLDKAPVSIKSFFPLRVATAKRAKAAMAPEKLQINRHAEAEASPPTCEQGRPPSKGRKGCIARRDFAGSALEDVEGGRGEKAWTCLKCTFVHVGPAKWEYLACEMCGSERVNAGNGGVARKLDCTDRSL